MLSIVDFQSGDKVLDLGCGYGVVGILAAKLIGAENVVMLDADPQAITVALKNIVCNNVAGIKLIQSDGFANLDDKDFTLILSNPPYHTDFSVAKHFIEKGFNRLALGGRMVMVTKRKEWYKNKLIAIFGGVKIVEINGYYVFVADKRSPLYANAVKKKK
jgi:16S rRNA (guanine1207-N2)-methyltransferase